MGFNSGFKGLIHSAVFFRHAHSHFQSKFSNTEICVFSLNFHYIFFWSDDSSVGIATLYGLDGPCIEYRWGRDFSAPVQTSPGAHPACYTMGTGSFPGVKRPGRGVDHPPPSRAEVKERVELWNFVACSRVNLYFR